jgi:hypothetical protein
MVQQSGNQVIGLVVNKGVK